MIKKTLIIEIILILLGSIVCVAIVPKVYAAEMTPQQKAITILNDVIGIDTNLYL